MWDLIIVCHVTILVVSRAESNFKEIVHLGYWFADTGFTVTLWIVLCTLGQTSGLGISSSLARASNHPGLDFVKFD